MLKAEVIDNVTVVSFQNVTRLNALIADQVKTELNSFFSKPNMKLVLNLEGVTVQASAFFFRL
jgi:hypothetical protein